MALFPAREQCGQEIKHPGSCNWPPGVNSLLTNSKTSLDELDQISENEDTFCKLCTDQNQYENQSIRIQTAKSWPYTIQLLVEEVNKCIAVIGRRGDDVEPNKFDLGVPMFIPTLV